MQSILELWVMLELSLHELRDRHELVWHEQMLCRLELGLTLVMPQMEYKAPAGSGS
jgi:hypothetical protein